MQSKYFFVLPLTLFSILFSCKKENTGDTSHDGKSIVIEDLAGDTGASLNEGVDGKEKRPFYIFLFRLKDQKQIWIKNATDSAQWLATNDWDLAFTGPYNSEVYVNNGSQQNNPGYGGTAQSAIVMEDRPYAQVNEAPADAAFSASDIKSVGWAVSETSAGWFSYNLSNHLVQPIKSRTYIIKLADGKFAKLELLNVYKGNPPVVTDLYWPAPYLTFRYYVQQDGSRNINTQ